MVKQGLADSREKAKALIMSGVIFVDGQREDKPGAFFPDTAALELHGKTLAYVSRGGLKLEKAIDCFSVSPDGKICMDIGASTGGFTDCMLQNGAVKVYGVDVGYGQLAWKLRQDPRVICMEKTNIRYVTPDQIPDPIELASVDVSFISLSKVLPAALPLLAPEGEMLCLIKPQFEAGREKVGKKGVVRDPKTHVEVIEAVISCAQALDFQVLGLDYSPIRGPEGNIEYLLWLKKGEKREAFIPEPEAVVKEAHAALDH